MAEQVHYAAAEGRGECYFTGANAVVDIDVDAPSGGDSFTTADAINVVNATTGEGDIKHADITAVSGPAYFTNNGATPAAGDAHRSFPLAQDAIMPVRNSRTLIKKLKFFVPVGTTLKVSWIA